jgi:DNA-binding NtrC family response regulator
MAESRRRQSGSQEVTAGKSEPKRPRALLVDDDTEFAAFITDALASKLRIDHVDGPAAAMKEFRSRSYDIVFLDIDLGVEETGIDLMKRMKALDPETPIVMLTKSAEVPTIIESIKGGAFYYVIKGTAPSLHEIAHIAGLAIEDARLKRAVSQIEEDQGDPLSSMRGTSDAMARIRRQIARVAPLDCSVLITGESGTGKELVARALHSASGRARGRFVAVNCGALPDQLVESELFGHEKGAFTGADRRRTGKFEHASRGTLLLDEIGNMPLDAQAKLLRVLESKEFERVGGNQTVEADARVVSATNRDLKTATTSGEFREDLYYRINEFTIHVPSLRERREDIPEIALHLVERVGREIGKRDMGISRGALDLLAGRDWRRNNVRELRNAILGALIQCDGDTLQPGDLSVDEITSSEVTPKYADVKRATVEHFQRRYFTHLLRLTKGNIAAAAATAGIHRAALHRHLVNLGIDADEFRNHKDGSRVQSTNENREPDSR